MDKNWEKAYERGGGALSDNVPHKRLRTQARLRPSCNPTAGIVAVLVATAQRK